MSKKMSIQDMKEVRRIVTNILTDSLEPVPTITVNHYRQKTSFSSHLGYNAYTNQAEILVHTSPITQEISDLQRQLTKKKNELLKSAASLTKKELKDDEAESDEIDKDGKIHDDYGVISKAVSSVNNVLRKRSEERAEAIAEEYNDYLSKIESRTFDAYTKGMSADDFLAVIREEIKGLQFKAQELHEELKINGYNDKDD